MNNYITTSHLLQKTPTGDETTIQVSEFQGLSGPSIYIQANLHGSETFGTPLIGRLIEYLKTVETIQGHIILVPCANPLAVQDTALAHAGRFNQKSGANWNRIFTHHQQWASLEDKIQFLQQKLQLKNLSIEEKLESLLHLIAKNPDYVLDIHCCGFHSCPYIFTQEQQLETFLALEPSLAVCSPQINDTNTAFIGGFTDSFATLKSQYHQHTTHACTWEVSQEQIIDAHHFEVQWQRLKGWVDGLLSIHSDSIENPKRTDSSIECIARSIDDFDYIYSHGPGYIIWQKNVGDEVAPGEEYICFYNPKTQAFQRFSEDKAFILVSKYTLSAVGEGEMIGERLWL